MEEALDAWTGTLEKVFPTRARQINKDWSADRTLSTKDIYVCKHKIAQPTVFIPVFPGTNCEYDSCKSI